MLSVHCASMLGNANNLKKFLEELGYTVFLCDQMLAGDQYRSAISGNALRCKVFIAFMNAKWCTSRECEYEFNIALRTNLTNAGVPKIIPLLLEDFALYKQYDSIYGMLCSTNGLVVKESELNLSTWQKIEQILQLAVEKKGAPAPVPAIPPAELPLPTVTVPVSAPAPIVSLGRFHFKGKILPITSVTTQKELYTHLKQLMPMLRSCPVNLQIGKMAGKLEKTPFVLKGNDEKIGSGIELDGSEYVVIIPG